MGRPGYMSIYADELTQKIFDDFVNEKEISKTEALSMMMEIYMISQDEQLYLELKKKAMNVEVAKRMILEKSDSNTLNDYIFIKLGTSYNKDGMPLTGYETIEAYCTNIEENGRGYTWFSTQSLFFGMSKKKVDYYNKLISRGEKVVMLFAIGGEINDICYSARVGGIVSDKDQQPCPGEPNTVPKEFSLDETARIWIKLSEIKEESRLKAAMFKIRSNDSDLKQVISNSQYHFGYVYLK